MPTDRRLVVVAGATGRLGLVVEILLRRGHFVRAMTRYPDSPAAARLRRLGAEVVRGDFDDPQTMVRPAAGADALFATGTAHRAGPAGELRLGQNVVAAAAAADVPHVVFSSGDGAAADSPLELFRVKAQVEEHVRAFPRAHTILAPVYFMENLFNPWNLPALKAGVVPSPIPVDAPLQQVAIADVARFAAHVIEHPDRFSGRRVRLASDELAAVDAALVLSRILGRTLEARQVPSAELPPGLRALFAWLERPGHDVDIAALHRAYPEIGWHTYDSWARLARGGLLADAKAVRQA